MGRAEAGAKTAAELHIASGILQLRHSVALRTRRLMGTFALLELEGPEPFDGCRAWT